MPDLDPLSAHLPIVIDQAVLYRVRGRSLMPQEHALLEAYPSLESDLAGAAHTVATHCRKVLENLQEAFFLKPSTVEDSSHLDFWRLDRAKDELWHGATIDDLFPSMRGTSVSQECEEILKGAMQNIEIHLWLMKQTLLSSPPVNDTEMAKSDLPDIFAKFHFRRDLFPTFEMVRTVLHFDIIFDGKSSPLINGCEYACFGFVFQCAIYAGVKPTMPALPPAWLVELLRTHPDSSNEYTTSQQDLPDICSTRFTLDPSIAPTVTAEPSSAAASIASAPPAQTAGTMGPRPLRAAFTSVAAGSIPPSFVSFGGGSHDDSRKQERQ